MSKPLWLQLLWLWLGAVLLAALLLAIDLQRPWKFFWLIPYPNPRLLLAAAVGFFRIRPLSATAVVGVPVVAILLTLGLCIARLLPLLRRAGLPG
jgi:formate-dependent nitrite reductase membrane component NrfD